MGSRTANQIIGQAGEQRALDHLIAQGCLPVAVNQGGKVGEIDLIVRDADEWVFVEVRSRSSQRFGGAAASVGPAKQAKLRRAAQLFLQRRFGHSAWPACRFDVVALDSEHLNWIKNAF